MLKYVLFDLDGTLLPMDQDVFVRAYFKELVKKIAPLGYEPEKLKNAVWTGMKYMVGNDGTQTNEEVFWKSTLRKLHAVFKCHCEHMPKLAGKK